MRWPNVLAISCSATPLETRRAFSASSMQRKYKKNAGQPRETAVVTASDQTMRGVSSVKIG
jgi:hypothetical protein